MTREKNNSTALAAEIDINGILTLLPHRYPFLMVDRVLEYVPGKSLTALKNVSYNEPYFTGHFPIRPVMPGVLILEALAQATGILAFISTESKPEDDTLYYFVGVDNARFRRPVEPGDQLILDVSVTRNMRNVWRFDSTARVDGQVVATAGIMCAAKPV